MLDTYSLIRTILHVLIDIAHWKTLNVNDYHV